MRNAHCEGLLEDVLEETIPMHARMIHGRQSNSQIFEEAQQYDVHGRVSVFPSNVLKSYAHHSSTLKQSTAPTLTNVSWTLWNSYRM